MSKEEMEARKIALDLKPVKCPECGEVIRELNLVREFLQSQYYSIKLNEDGELDCEWRDTVEGDDETYRSYRCPECDETIAEDENDAISFLRGEREETEEEPDWHDEKEESCWETP